MTASICCGDGCSDPCSVGHGVKQGCVLAPTLSQDEKLRIRKRKLNVAEIYETVAETRREIRVSAVGFVTFTRVSVAAVTAEPDHILHVSARFQLKETTVSASVTSR